MGWTVSGFICWTWGFSRGFVGFRRGFSRYVTGGRFCYYFGQGAGPYSLGSAFGYSFGYTFGYYTLGCSLGSYLGSYLGASYFFTSSASLALGYYFFSSSLGFSQSFFSSFISSFFSSTDSSFFFSQPDPPSAAAFLLNQSSTLLMTSCGQSPSKRLTRSPFSSIKSTQGQARTWKCSQQKLGPFLLQSKSQNFRLGLTQCELLQLSMQFFMYRQYRHQGEKNFRIFIVLVSFIAGKTEVVSRKCGLPTQYHYSQWARPAKTAISQICINTCIMPDSYYNNDKPMCENLDYYQYSILEQNPDLCLFLSLSISPRIWSVFLPQAPTTPPPISTAPIESMVRSTQPWCTNLPSTIFYNKKSLTLSWFILNLYYYWLMYFSWRRRCRSCSAWVFRIWEYSALLQDSGCARKMLCRKLGYSGFGGWGLWDWRRVFIWVYRVDIIYAVSYCFLCFSCNALSQFSLAIFLLASSVIFSQNFSSSRLFIFIACSQTSQVLQSCLYLGECAGLGTGYFTKDVLTSQRDSLCRDREPSRCFSRSWRSRVSSISFRPFFYLYRWSCYDWMPISKLYYGQSSFIFEFLVLFCMARRFSSSISFLLCILSCLARSSLLFCSCALAINNCMYIRSLSNQLTCPQFFACTWASSSRLNFIFLSCSNCRFISCMRLAYRARCWFIIAHYSISGGLERDFEDFCIFGVGRQNYIGLVTNKDFLWMKA